MWHTEVSSHSSILSLLSLHLTLLLRVGFLQINSEFLPLQNEALGSCFKMRSILARKVYVVHVVLWRICRTIDSISWTTHIRPNLESWQKKWRFLCAKRRVRMFRAMLFIIANKTKQWQLKKKKNWKQPTRPLTGEWINKLWCIHIMEYCIAMKMTKLQLSAPTRMNLKNNVEWYSKLPKNINSMTSLYKP